MPKDSALPSLDEIAAHLKERAMKAPDRRRSKYQLIVGLLPTIEELKALRMTDAEIVAALAEKGAVIGLGTFQQYLSKAKREAGGDQPAKPRRASRMVSATPAAIKAAPAPAPAAAPAPTVEQASDKGGKVALSHNPNRKL